MKISYRILVINFAIVFLILVSATVAYYSIMYNVLTSQQSKYLLNSVNDFVYAYRELLQTTDDNFADFIQNNNTSIINKNLDFVLQKTKTSADNISKKYASSKTYIPHSINTLEEFIKNNPFAIIKTYKSEGGKVYYYGRVINQEFINTVSQKIGADVALVWNGTPLEVSNEETNQTRYYLLSDAFQKLSSKSNFEIYSQGSSSADLLTTIYRPARESELNGQIDFLIFTTLGEMSDLRNNLFYIIVIIGFAGIALSLILTLVFTDKIRKQIFELNDATKQTKLGNFKSKIKIQSKDEIGQLAGAFNVMLDELDKREKAKNEYSEFITLINQNPTLAEISEASLRKIIKTAGFVVGALYTVDENEEVNLASSYGLKKDQQISSRDVSFFDVVIKNKELYEVSFEESPPVVSLGLVNVEIKHLLIVPIIYTQKVIAILELGASANPTLDAREYIAKIQEQLAIGITNATAFVQLKNLVAELKKLNEDYQKQNIQIRKQNETLVDLHKKLKEKADELEIQKRKAEEATQLKSQFLASMSHELRTPMNSILGLTELILEETSLIGKNRERLEVVFKSSKRLMNLINDILDLSKIEAGKMELHNENVLLEELIRDVETSISPLVNNKSIDFKISRNCNTRIIINIEREKVTQVLINLLGNAIKFTENGFVELVVSTKDKKLLLEVKDTGIGISNENLKIIFEEFRQADGTTTRKFGGTGLGLAICNRIAGLLHGKISVESELGKGSKFSFAVPLNFVADGSIEDDQKINVDKLIENRLHPILVIDNDPEVRSTIGKYLISKGYEVIYAEDGERGLSKAIEIKPFAITLDVLLPKKDGWSVLKELKENPETKDIPVILISIMGEKNLGYGLGAFEYYVKPITPDNVQTAFDKLEKLTKKKIEKIVIVDDDDIEFERFKSVFKGEKIRIDYISDSELAFSKILESQPDLIVLDLLMPGIDGITLSHKLKSNKDTKHIPIIISTAKDLTEEERDSLYSIVESITLKSNRHPLDVLKIVRDRLQIQESLPARDKESDNAEGERLEFKSSPQPRKNLLGEVLIVDDDPDTLFTINEIVESCNCKTTLAKNGVECLKVLEKKIPDLILLDIMMPEMDGFQAIDRIRNNPQWSGIPVIAVTAKAMLEDKEVILKHGFDDYIPKPVNPTVMSFKIKKLFSKIKVK